MQLSIQETTAHSLPSPRSVVHRAKYLWPLIASMLLLSGCDNYKNLELGLKRASLQDECFGQLTNTCTSKAIDFNIAVLQSADAEGAITAGAPQAKQQMIDTFGPNGWPVFEESFNTVRDHYIQAHESARPGRFARWFRGDEPPRNGGIRVYWQPEDLGPFLHDVQKEFAQRMQASGFKPSPEALAKFGPKSGAPVDPASSEVVPPPLSGPASPTPAQEQAAAASAVQAEATAKAIEAAQLGQLAPPTSQGNATAASGAVPSAEWLALQQQIKTDPQGFVRQCMDHDIQSAQELGGLSHEDAVQREGAGESCQQLLVDLQNCTKLDPVAGERCRDAFTQDRE